MLCDARPKKNYNQAKPELPYGTALTSLQLIWLIKSTRNTIVEKNTAFMLFVFSNESTDSFRQNLFYGENTVHPWGIYI